MSDLIGKTGIVLRHIQRAEAALVARSVLASGTFAEDMGALQAGQQGPWQWRLQVVQQPVAITNPTGQPPESPMVPGARVDIQVARAGAGTVFEMTAWKPYRTAP